MTSTPLEQYICASADHQDALFRLVQYLAKLVGSCYYGRRRDALSRLSGAIDSSRIMYRSFGIIYALRAVRSAPSTQSLRDRLGDLSLLFYHPTEIGYWLLLVTNSPATARLRTFSRLSSFFGMAWSAISMVDQVRRLREWKDMLQAARARRAVALASSNHDSCGAPASPESVRSYGSGFGPSGPAGGIVSAEELLLDAEADEAELKIQILEARRRLGKLVLDATLCLNWALDDPKYGFSSFTIGWLGTMSAWLGLRLSYDAHALAVAEEQAVAEEEEEEERVRAAAVADRSPALSEQGHD